MKKICLFLLAIASTIAAEAQTIKEGNWQLTLNNASKTLIISNNNTEILNGVYAVAKYRLGTAAATIDADSRNAVSVTKAVSDVDDDLGQGRKHTLVYTLADGISMKQDFSFYDGDDDMIVQLTISKDGVNISSNYMAPLWTETQSTFLPSSSDLRKYNRMLFVPWDNDQYVSYQSMTMNGNEVTSYSANAFFNGSTRYGLVAGAIDHDSWKSVVYGKSANYGSLNAFHLLSGYADTWSHDTGVGHGWLTGTTVSSARFTVGMFDDWRDGMEHFAKDCAKVAEPLAWAGAKPVGWNSWGVQQTAVSLQGAEDVGDFMLDNLKAHGFHDANGKLVMSLDSWWNNNFTDQQIKDFVAYCNANDMIPGLYYGPWCDWNTDSTHTVEGSSKYKGGDRWLRANGEFVKVDGACCNDPTHPATKVELVTNLNKFKRWGIKYLKCDFMSNGAVDADSWYDSNVHTGIQAYNQGMKFFIDQVKSKLGDDCFIDLSIAPAFPYQYAHGRRSSCDCWGKISETKYMMNSLSFGWWLDNLYFSLDPDHLVLKHESGATETDGENRARVTSGVICGAYLTGDNFSDNVSKGNPSESRKAALKFLTNDDVNEIPRTCQSFRPVDGTEANGTGAENLMQGESSDYWYLAVFNYSILPATGKVTWEYLGINPDSIGEIKELWLNGTVSSNAEQIAWSLPGRDARIFRIAKKHNASGIATTQASQATMTLHDGLIDVYLPTGVSRITVTDTTGKVMAETKLSAVSTDGWARGVYIVNATDDCGNKHVWKMVNDGVH